MCATMVQTAERVICCFTLVPSGLPVTCNMHLKPYRAEAIKKKKKLATIMKQEISIAAVCMHES